MTNPQCPFCNTPLSEHEAGRCLDVFIHTIKEELDFKQHKSFFHWLKVGNSIGSAQGQTIYLDDIPRYSTDMNEAMKLWNGIFHHGTQSHLTRMGTGKNITYKLVMPQMYRTDYFPIATTPALALCRAYLIDQMKEE